MSDKFKITDDFSGFTLEYRWFNPMAYGLVIFTIFWIGFLIFWYSMALLGSDGGAAMAPFLLVPLVHVAVGIGLAYYTACLFLNRTYVQIADNYLRIDHQPLPWWKGKKEMPVREIEQLFVKEKIGSKGRRSYQLHVKTTTGKTQSLLTIPNIDQTLALQLEQTLERKLDIVDQPVVGEYNSGKSFAPAPAGPRRTDTPASFSSVKLHHLRVGDFVDYERTTYEVIYATQYDWQNGDTDKLFQLYSARGKEQLIYLHQNAGIYTPWREYKLDHSDQSRLAFDPEQPTTELLHDDERYRLTEQTAGTVYRQAGAAGLPATQWTYLDADRNRQLRILSINGAMDVYLGGREILGSFENLLTP